MRGAPGWAQRHAPAAGVGRPGGASGAGSARHYRMSSSSVSRRAGDGEPSVPSSRSFVAAALAAGSLLTGPAVRADPPPTADAATVDGTVAVVPVELPPKRRGRRAMTYALGRETSAAAAAVIEESLRTIRAFAAYGVAGDHALEVTITDAEQELTDFTDAVSRRSTVAVQANISWTWRRGDAAVHAGEALVDSRVEAWDRIRRHDIRRAWEELLIDAGRTAFGEAYEAGAFASRSEAMRP